MHTETFTHNYFTYRNCYTQKQLPPDVFPQKKTIHRRFAHGNFYAQTRPHTVALTHRKCYTEKSLHIFYHLSYLKTIHDLSSSYLSVHVLLVNFLCSSFGRHCRLVFMSPRVLSIHASSPLPLRRIKLNKSPGIDSD